MSPQANTGAVWRHAEGVDAMGLIKVAVGTVMSTPRHEKQVEAWVPDGGG